MMDTSTTRAKLSTLILMKSSGLRMKKLITGMYPLVKTRLSNKLSILLLLLRPQKLRKK